MICTASSRVDFIFVERALAAGRTLGAFYLSMTVRSDLGGNKRFVGNACGELLAPPSCPIANMCAGWTKEFFMKKNLLNLLIRHALILIANLSFPVYRGWLYSMTRRPIV
jgi:hypothetical protein